LEHTPSKILRDESGELSPGYTFLILFVIAAAIVISLTLVYFTRHAVTQGAKDAAKSAALEIYSTRSISRGRTVAVNVANGNSSDLAEFEVRGSNVFVRLESRNQLETFKRIPLLKEYVITTATADATIQRGGLSTD